MTIKASADHVIAHPVTRMLGGALLALATVLINDVRDTVGKQSKVMASLQTENIKLSYRVDVLELRLQLSTAELEKRLAQWDRYWSEFQPAMQRWIERQENK